MRLRQVLRNLLSNALKFTEQGSVTLRIAPVVDRRGLPSSLHEAEQVIALSVSDTGIGIAKEKQQIIFEAFQQADGGTSRKYGGTGLGLNISREIASLLGGELTVESEPGRGSTFTLYLPDRYVPRRRSERPPMAPTRLAAGGIGTVADVRAGARRSTPACCSSTGRCRRRSSPTTGCSSSPATACCSSSRTTRPSPRPCSTSRATAASAASSPAPAPRRSSTRARVRPDAITLDLLLPDMDGWVLLDRLKHDADVRHIPVHIISAAGMGEERRGLELRRHGGAQQAAREGGAGVDARGDAGVPRPPGQAPAGGGGRRDAAPGDRRADRRPATSRRRRWRSAEEALEALAGQPFDCLVLDLKLPGMSGMELIQRIKDDPALRRLPIVVYTGKELSREEQNGLAQLAETVIVKDVRSPERLLDETALFLHRVEASLPETKRRMLRNVAYGDPLLKGRRVLVVDDDVRNIFAITSVLERHEMDVQFAENGHDALAKLAADDAVDVVLMDIMMPEMDGYEAMRRIRAQPKFKGLPIIALTAKAMKGDREKCIDAGASDYVTKPVDPDQLISLLRVWLYR